MKVLAIDPGYDRLGIAVVENSPQCEVVHFSTCLTTDKNLSLAQRILIIGDEIEKLILSYAPDSVAIETLFFNKNVKTAIGVAQARGVILYLAQKHNCEIYELGPQQIKVAITGYGKSDKSAVNVMLQKLCRNIPPKALDDEYDAIAVGVTCLAYYGKKSQSPHIRGK
ncbi:MAG TPA: crossover junction endodeoxyribonuclease RuvC [Candidatus Paceibacterota bacterium]|nr:crossover junction endodeoxyribonuclease RuvC [Candidatus Paceibacterota bacterium]HMO82605.1 crossover junction endodeoxyribonuclease RuvC [Candidatus Paceibacterota bacterium]